MSRVQRPICPTASSVWASATANEKPTNSRARGQDDSADNRAAGLGVTVSKGGDMFCVSGSRAGILRAVVTASVALAVAGCGATSASGNGQASPDAPRGHAARCQHGVGFALSLASDIGGQPTPAAAARWFAAHGGQDLPTHGWRVVGRDQDGVTLHAASSSVHVAQGSDGTWQVDSGTSCR